MEQKIEETPEWKRTLTGKLIVFWIFTILMPLGFIVAIIFAIKGINAGNKAFIALLVFAIIDLLIVLFDMFVVAKRNSAGALRALGIVCILGIGLIIQGIFMILMADYVDSQHEYVESKPIETTKCRVVGIQSINISDRVTDWEYHRIAKTLVIHFYDKVVNIEGITKDFIKNEWSVMSSSEQTNYFFKNWKK